MNYEWTQTTKETMVAYFKAGLANFNGQEGQIIRYDLAWAPHLCVYISKRDGGGGH